MQNRLGYAKRGALGACLVVVGVLAGCATHERVIVRETVAVRPAPRVKPMPAAIREDRGPAPGRDWGWVAGHWKWEGADWFWVHGSWVHQQVAPPPPIIVEEITVAPSPRHFWVPGHWVWRFDGNGGWFWVRGGWHS